VNFSDFLSFFPSPSKHASNKPDGKPYEEKRRQVSDRNRNEMVERADLEGLGAAASSLL